MPESPLHGLRVLDLTRVLAGPWCTMTLGDLGADVIKVEALEGDDTRTWGPPFADDMSAYYTCVNRNKRSLAVNLKDPRGLALVRQLALKADVVVENFKTGGAEKLGLGYAALKGDNPGLVYCAISGYGRTGSRKDLPGYDFIIQAEGGIMSITGEEVGMPSKVGVAIVDITTGQNAVAAILAALVARGRTGKGQYIDISLFDTQIQWLANVASNTLFSGKDAKRWGNAHANIVPYQAFEASDGWFTVAVGNDSQFQKLCQLVEKPEWASDTRFATNPARVAHRTVLIPLLERVFRRRNTSDWLDQLEAAGIPCGRVQSVQKALNHPVTHERGLRLTMAHPLTGKALPMVGSPLHLSDTPVNYRRPPPAVGQHTREILQTDLNLTESELKTLFEAGVIGVQVLP
jgi:crotonobetainyl-CoA:carnitine CoA-transferase CaiB-like acyl-CoA transferase